MLLKMSLRTRRGIAPLLTAALGACWGSAGVCQQTASQQTGTDSDAGKQAKLKPAKAPGKETDVPPLTGTLHLWEDHGALTPVQVFWGAASRDAHPEQRLPKPPFTNFELDDSGTSPKCTVTDKNGVEWTVKFGEEVHPGVAAPRLAWALGYAVDESYYVKVGKIEGIDSTTDRGRCSRYISMDGTFAEARFQGHDFKRVKGTHDKSDLTEDADWDERKNPGVPPEHLSGLMILEVMVHNWDSQPKNNRIIKINGPQGVEDWYIVSDWGASFGQIRVKGSLPQYQKETSFIRNVSGDTVNLKFDDVIKGMVPIHEKIPLAHARWFRKQLDALTDAHLRAAFHAAYANRLVYKAYTAGDTADNGVFDPLTASEIDSYVKAFRAKIEEFKAKVP